MAVERIYYEEIQVLKNQNKELSLILEAMIVFDGLGGIDKEWAFDQTILKIKKLRLAKPNQPTVKEEV